MLEISDYWLTFVVGTILPAAVALVTQRCTSSAVKAAVLAALSAIAGVATSVQEANGHFEWKSALSLFIVTFVTATAVHFGLLKPAGVTGTNGAIATALPGGVGSVEPKTDTSDSVDY